MTPPVNPQPNRAARRRAQRARGAPPVDLPRDQTQIKRYPRVSPIQSLKNLTGIGGQDSGEAGDMDHLPPMDLPAVDGSGKVAGDTPPKGQRKPRRSTKADSDTQILQGLTRFYGLAGMAIGMADQYDGQVVMAMADGCARGWLEVGHAYPEVYKTLKLITGSNIWMDIGMAHAAIAVGLGANHGLFSPTWVIPFNLPIPQPRVRENAEVPMGMDQPPSPLDRPYQPPAEPRVDASATGLGSSMVDGAPRVEFDASIMDTIRRQAYEAELAERAQAAAQEQMAATGMPGYNPADVLPRAEQNPAFLQNLIRKRG